MKLNFVIDKNYLIKHTLTCAEHNLFSSDKNKKDVLDFNRYALKQSSKCYDFLVGTFSPSAINEKNLKSFIKSINDELPKFLNEVKCSKEFKKIYSQTEKYLKFCEEQWNKNYEKTIKIVEKLIGFKLNKTFTVYITHPSQRNGSYWGNNKISWGVNEKWKNYTVIYLWHEILHSYFDDSNSDHVIIELITDEELRNKLNKTKYPPFEGHKALTKLKKEFLPYWKKYLKSKDKNIKKFRKEAKKLLLYRT